MGIQVQRNVEVLTTANGEKYVRILDLVDLIGNSNGASLDSLREALIKLLVQKDTNDNQS